MRKVLVVVGVLVLIIGSLSISGYLFEEKKSSRILIGDLGGGPVLLRKEKFFVSYDDAVEVSADDLRSPYKRRFRSVGFDVRYPDMMSRNAFNDDYENAKNTMWMRVLVSAGENYGSTGDDFLKNKFNHYLGTQWDCINECRRYEKEAGNYYGLIKYSLPISRDGNSGVGEEGDDSVDLFVFYNERNEISTLISCSNRRHEAAPCEQFFNLNPKMRARISVIYRRALLSNWMNIQSSLSKYIFGFKTGPI